MSLVVDRIRCIEESDEVGSDDIYLIVFQGRTVAPFVSGLNSIGPGNFWDDFDTGETRRRDRRVASTNADGVYAVMMVEEDNRKDIRGSNVLGAWRAQTALIWRAIMLSQVAAGGSTTSERARRAGFAGIRDALNGLAGIYTEFPFGNDDVIDVERVTINRPGQSQTIRFRSPSHLEDATYNVTFKHTNA